MIVCNIILESFLIFLILIPANLDAILANLEVIPVNLNLLTATINLIFSTNRYLMLEYL